jgi:hypothetical protein
LTKRESYYFAGTIIACLLLLLFRRYDAFVNPQFHAEEGKYFFAQAYNEGWSSLFETVNGYYHLWPRLVMNLSLSLQIPLENIPTVMMIMVLLTYLILWYYIFTRLQLSLFSRCAAVLVTVILPLGNEILMTMTNIQWFMALFPAVIIFGKKPARKSARTIDAFILILTVFTGPMALIMLPVIIFVFLKDKSQLRTRNQELFWVIFIGAIISLFSLISYGSVDRTEGEFSFLNGGFLQYLFFQTWYPILSTTIHDVPNTMGYILAALSFGVIVFVSLRILKNGNTFSLFCLISSYLFFIVTCISYRHDPGALTPFYCGIRNFFLPSVFFIWATLPLFERFTVFKSFKYFKSVKFISILLFTWFVIQTLVFIGPMRFEDMHWKEEVKRIGIQDTTVIPVNPKGWSLQLETK